MPQQEEPLQELLEPQLESNPHSPQLEKNPRSKEDPAEPKKEYFFLKKEPVKRKEKLGILALSM